MVGGVDLVAELYRRAGQGPGRGRRRVGTSHGADLHGRWRSCLHDVRVHRRRDWPAEVSVHDLCGMPRSHLADLFVVLGHPVFHADRVRKRHVYARLCLCVDGDLSGGALHCISTLERCERRFQRCAGDCLGVPDYCRHARRQVRRHRQRRAHHQQHLSHGFGGAVVPSRRLWENHCRIRRPEGAPDG
jgi:hypothetical protein